MNQKENIYKKAFIEAILSALGLVLAVFVVYSFMKAALPNLLLLGLIAFAIFYLVKLILFKIIQKPTTK